MRVAHEINLLDGVCDEERGLQQGRYRVYWTRLPGSSLKSFGVVESFGVVDTNGHMGPLGDAVVLDAQQSNGRAHAVQVADKANNLHAAAELLGLRVQVQAVAP